jgi:hypothetical protein
MQIQLKVTPDNRKQPYKNKLIKQDNLLPILAIVTKNLKLIIDALNKVVVCRLMKVNECCAVSW